MSSLSASAFKPVILKNDRIQMDIIPYGLHLHRFLVGKQDLVVGPEDPALYAKEGRSFRNTIVGRYANRLPVGSVEASGVSVNAQSNESPEVSLHGGPDGWDLREWSTVPRSESKLFNEGDAFEAVAQEAIFYLDSPAGDQGFPGALHVEALFQLYEDKATIVYRAAITDDAAATPINLTQHTGWTLNPFTSGDEENISEHLIRVDASRAVELDSKTSLATGKAIDVKSASKPLDFTTSTSLEKFLKQGVDDNPIFDRPRFESQREVINLSHPRSNVSLSFTSNQSSAMVYTAEHFHAGDGTRKDIHNPQKLTKDSGYPKHGCLFLEFHAPVGTFLHPDLVQANGDDDTVLKKGEVYEAWHTVKVNVK